MKQHHVLFLCLLLSLVLCGCPNPRVMEICATSQKGTAWQSEDGRVTFYVDDDAKGKAVCPVFGTIETDEGVVDVAIFMTYLTSDAEIIPADDPAAHDPNIGHAGLETWVYSDVREDSFRISVEKGYYLETGEELTFHKVEAVD